MTTFRAAAVLAFLAASAAAASAATVNVPADFPTIRSALDSSFDGDTIVVAAGTYPEFLFLDQRQNLTIRAQGVVILAPRGKKGAPATITLSSCQNITIDGLTFSKAPGNAVNVGTCLTVSILNCTIEGAKGAGIELDRTGGAQDGIVRRCTIMAAGDTGIVVTGARHVVEDNEITDSKQYGISVIQDANTATTGAIVRRNTITKTKKKDGILVSAPQSSFVSNTIASTRGDGIRVAETMSQVLTNSVTGAGAYGVHLLGAGHTVTGNTATGKKADLRDESVGSVLTNNTFPNIK